MIAHLNTMRRALTELSSSNVMYAQDCDAALVALDKLLSERDRLREALETIAQGHLWTGECYDLAQAALTETEVAA